MHLTTASQWARATEGQRSSAAARVRVGIPVTVLMARSSPWGFGERPVPSALAHTVREAAGAVCRSKSRTDGGPEAQ